jgi:hypothetical protein
MNVKLKHVNSKEMNDKNWHIRNLDLNSTVLIFKARIIKLGMINKEMKLRYEYPYMLKAL